MHWSNLNVAITQFWSASGLMGMESRLCLRSGAYMSSVWTADMLGLGLLRRMLAMLFMGPNIQDNRGRASRVWFPSQYVR